jgi:N4-gp56 family major capsid protein
MAVNTTLTLTAEAQTFCDKVLLKRMNPNLVFAKYGQKRPIPKNAGQTINFRLFSALEAATTPLTEGVAPSSTDLNISEVEATLHQYGAFVEISDVLDKTGIDPVKTEAAELLGEQAGLTLNSVVRDIICSGTNVQNATGKLTADEVKKAARTLKKYNAKPIEGNAYIGIIDPELSYDLQNDPLWQDVSKYNGGVKIMDGEIGKLGGVRFIETTETKVTSAGKHCAMIIAKDAYGVVDLENSAQKPEIVVKLNQGPLAQTDTEGWKAMYTAVRLNELAMVRIEASVSE